MRGVEVGEAVLVQAFEHALLHDLPGHAQKRADQGRPERVRLSIAYRKVI